MKDVKPMNDLWMIQVILRRMDGEVNFFRPWESYKRGFGNKEGKYWLGECFWDILGKKKANKEKNMQSDTWKVAVYTTMFSNEK